MKQYFALEDSLLAIVPIAGVADPSGYLVTHHRSCMLCDAKKGWEDTFSDALIAQGVDLERVIQLESTPGDPIFKMREGRLKLISRCVKLGVILRATAELLPED